MKRCFLVVAPECSGNHIVKRMFVMAGVRGSYQYEQELDDFLFQKKPLKEIIGSYDGDILHGDSMPARLTEFTDWVECAKRYEAEGYKVIWVLPMRDWFCVVGSKKSRNIVRESDVSNQLMHEYREVWAQVLKHGGDFWTVNISSLYEFPSYIRAEIKQLFGLEVPPDFDGRLFDANDKHRGGLVNG